MNQNSAHSEVDTSSYQRSVAPELVLELFFFSFLFFAPHSILPYYSSSETGNMSSPTPGFTPGYAEEDISSRVIISASIFIVLEIGAVALRCAARLNYKTKWGTDDYLMAPALLFSLGFCVTGISE